MDYVLFIIGLILGLATFAVLVLYSIKFVRTRPIKGVELSIFSKEGIKLLVLIGVTGLFTIMSSFGCMNMMHATATTGEVFMIIFGSYFLGTAVSALVSSFIVYYYRPDLIQKQRKTSRLIMYISIPVAVAGLWILTDAFAAHMVFPMWNGISFIKGFYTPVDVKNRVDLGFNIRFYGALIVAGAAISYFVSDHYFYKKFKKHGIIDTLLLVAFPAGIICARIWYCTVLDPSCNLFDIRSGGLAIQGGAIGGIVAGVIFMLIFRRYVNIRWAMDIIVPTILLAQVLGRWGNFFNCEVHGEAVDMAYFWFLPRGIVMNMQYSSVAPSLIGTNQIYLPLFLIEGAINLAGYFIIRYAIGKGLRKHLSLGDLAMCYISFYGLVRFLLEKLRYGSSGQAFMYDQSFITAIVMMAGGILGIVILHLYDFWRKKKGLPPRNLDTI